MICYRADSAARQSAYAVAGVEAVWLTHSVTTTVEHRLGMRPFTNSKRKNNRFPA